MRHRVVHYEDIYVAINENQIIDKGVTIVLSLSQSINIIFEFQVTEDQNIVKRTIKSKRSAKFLYENKLYNYTDFKLYKLYKLYNLEERCSFSLFFLSNIPISFWVTLCTR